MGIVTTCCFKCGERPARDAQHHVCGSCHSTQYCHVCQRKAVARAAEVAAKRAAERKAKQKPKQKRRTT